MLTILNHKIHLSKILTAIYSDSMLSPVLGFKGGTAAYLFYQLPRFSVDLDFDLIDPGKISKKNITKLASRLTDILSREYIIIEKSLKLHTLFWLISYEKGQQKIKVEISIRYYPNIYVSRNYYGVNIPVMKLSDMIAHKLVSITDRKIAANRDLYDAHYFLNLKDILDINYEIIRILTGQKPLEFYLSLLKHIEMVDNNRILSGLGEVLDGRQKLWVKAHLLKELKNRILFLKDMVKENAKK